MIRWTYLAPRMAVVGALLLFLGHGVDPLMRWSLISGGQSLIGAKVEVETVSTSLMHSQLAARNVAIANPKSPNTNLMSADYLWLDLDGAALTKNHIVIREGAIHGLRINCPRDSSGRLKSGEPADDDLGEDGRQWLKDAAQALGDQALDDLESVQLARQLRRRWPEQYKTLEQRIDAWLDQVKALEQLPDQLRGDVLAQAEQVRRAALTVRSLREELASIRADFQRLHQQARIDRTDLADASARDVEKVQQRLVLAKLEPDTLTDYFLGPDLGPQTREAIQWVQWVRGQIPSTDVPQPDRGRGKDILFTERNPQPWLLAQSLGAEGEILWNGQAIPFVAVASDWTVEPTVHGQPATVQLKTIVPAESWIALTIDRTGLHAKDHLSLVCPQLPTSAKELGDADYLAINLPSGTADVRAAFTLVNDQVAGTIQLRRQNTPLELTVGKQLRDSNLAARLQQRISDVNELSVLVKISGPITSPRTSIESPLGEQMRLAIGGALQDEIDVRREQLAAKARREINEEIESLQTELATHKTAVMQKLNLADQQQQAVEQLVADAFGMPKNQLGRKLLQAIQRR